MVLQGMNPSAQNFEPKITLNNYDTTGMASGVASHLGPNIGAQVAQLILDVQELRTQQVLLKEEVNMLKEGGWTVNSSPATLTNDMELPLSNGNGTMAAGSSQKNGTVIADGHVSSGSDEGGSLQASNLAPHEASNFTTGIGSNHQDGDIPLPSVEDPYQQSSKDWKPLVIRQLAPLPRQAVLRIPPATMMRTFSFDFLRETLGGIEWSPGLYYCPPTHGPCVLPNRTYYAIDATHQPYLPEYPGGHGATLTAFFNANPEEQFGDDANAAYKDVPLFVCASPYAIEPNKRRFLYFGTYSQVRWSDKLDYDHVAENVPQSTKMYWAEELSAVGRAEWVTDALMKHFWPKPEYTGRLFGAQIAEGSVTEDGGEEEEAVMKDIKAYVRELKAWENDARMKVSMIKKEFILSAFERADADDPPSLRLWWEYLECVGWDRDFYRMLAERAERSTHP